MKDTTANSRDNRQATDVASRLPTSLSSPFLHLLIILVVGILAYSNSLHVPFVLDDKSSIVENHIIKSLSGFFQNWSGFAYNPRRAIAYLSFALNYHFGGLSVTGFHIFNLAVHLITSLLVYCLCRQTFKTPFLRDSRLLDSAPFIGLIAAILFVSHPVQTQAVTYISQRFASMATMFYLMAMALYAQARLLQENGAKSTHWKTGALFLFSLVAALLSMMTKEIAFTLPVMLVVYECFFFSSSIRKKVLLVFPAIIAVCLISLTLLNSTVPFGQLLSDIDTKLNAAVDISRLSYLFTQFCVITTYVRLLILPVNQNLDYAYPVYHSLFTPLVFCCFLFLAGLVALATLLFIRSRKNQNPELRLISFGIFWFFIALAVESSVIPIADVIFEHRLYLPSAGVFIAVAAILAMIPRQYRNISITAVVVAVSLLTIATWKRNVVWGDELTLWQDTVNKSPQKDRPHNNLGEALKRKGRIDEAVREVEAALKLNPNNAEAHSNLGAAYLDRGDREKALEHLQAAVKLNPSLSTAHYNLGIIYKQTGQIDKASEHFIHVLKLNPDSADAHNHLAVTYAAREMLEPAIEHFKEAVRLKPDRADYRKNLDMALQMKQSSSSDTFNDAK